MTDDGDQAFRGSTNSEMWQEMTYGGALSFLRRRYSREIEGVDVVVMVIFTALVRSHQSTSLVASAPCRLPDG